MAIITDQHTITIHTKNTSYQMVISEYNFLIHLYYGKKISGDLSYLLTYFDRGFSGNPSDALNDRTFSLDVLPQEYPCYGTGDFRTAAFNLRNSQGVYGCDLRYKSHKVTLGKYSLPKLPAVYANTEEAQTLEILLEDTVTGVEVTLYYGVMEQLDVITRAVAVKNSGAEELKITKAYSSTLDFMEGEYDVLHFHGRHGMERILERTPVLTGRQSYGSIRGTSSHHHNPFLILADHNTTEEDGSCYGMSLLYSGNFKCEVEKDQCHQTRFAMGIQDEMLEYPLAKGEIFYSPEVAMSYSDTGLTALSQNYHDLLRYHVCRGSYQTKRRPILINNWEATYFDFNGDKLYQIAKQAAELGVEMFVLDDGWFGKRDSDNSGLGDWVVNEKKMGSSLSDIVTQVNQLGMKFGLWIEPEMVNEDSNLYRAHPDWAFQIPGRKPIRGRNQLVLDFSRKEVVDNIFEQISAVVDQLNLAYIKMDMNRNIMDIYSATEGYQNAGTIMYQYVLGVYDFLERFIQRYPDLLIEGCSGGGGRYDAGMLYYTPQIWCSDNTDAIERIRIQHGTSFGYPVSSVGSHVSASPNEQTGRKTNIHTRAVVAMAGSFGYELDLNMITKEEKEEVRNQIKDYKKYWNLIHNGNYYRLHTPQEDTEVAAWMFATKDKKEGLLNLVSLDTHCNSPVNYVKCKGLDEYKNYYIENEDAYYEKGTVYSGSALMYGGIPVPVIRDEYQALQIHFVEV
ncbi:MAG: alpha-galactosidase [Velocimicrobium sp.]